MLVKDIAKVIGFGFILAAVISLLAGHDFFEPAVLGLLLMILGHVFRENGDASGVG